jgi:hypothetical protein
MNALALAAGLIWLIVANVAAMVPSKDHHWSIAYRLIAVGVPVLIWVGWTSGPFWALAFVIAAASVLRWPLVRHSPSCVPSDVKIA